MTLRPRHFAGAAALVAALLAWTQPGRDLGFTTMASAGLLDAYGARFGSGARKRLEGWKQFAGARKSTPVAELELLTTVNTWMNRIRFIDDIRHWGREDYWATPAETVASDGGDCEDYSIAKYFLLKELGVPIARLRLTYVNAVKLGQAHMVLAYYSRPDAEPLVLDNLDPAVRPASQRPDLVPVYSFNDEEVWIEARGRSGSPRQIRNWSAVIERLEQEARM